MSKFYFIEETGSTKLKKYLQRRAPNLQLANQATSTYQSIKQKAKATVVAQIEHGGGTGTKIQIIHKR